MKILPKRWRKSHELPINAKVFRRRGNNHLLELKKLVFWIICQRDQQSIQSIYYLDILKGPLRQSLMKPRPGKLCTAFITS